MSPSYIFKHNYYETQKYKFSFNRCSNFEIILNHEDLSSMFYCFVRNDQSENSAVNKFSHISSTIIIFIYSELISNH